MGLGGEQGFLVSFVLRTLDLLGQAQGWPLWQKEDPGPALEVLTLLRGEQFSTLGCARLSFCLILISVSGFVAMTILWCFYNNPLLLKCNIIQKSAPKSTAELSHKEHSRVTTSRGRKRKCCFLISTVAAILCLQTGGTGPLAVGGGVPGSQDNSRPQAGPSTLTLGRWADSTIPPQQKPVFSDASPSPHKNTNPGILQRDYK